MSERERPQAVRYIQGVWKPTERSMMRISWWAPAMVKMVTDLDKCDHGEDLQMTAAAGLLTNYL